MGVRFQISLAASLLAPSLLLNPPTPTPTPRPSIHLLHGRNKVRGARCALCGDLCKHLPGDRVGGFACLLSLAPIFVLISLGTLLLSRRDPATLLFIAGLIASTLFNDYLKLVIKEPRPCSDTHYCSLSEGDVYGMPSGHTQFQAFAAAYISLWALSGRWREPSALLRWAVVAGCWASVACVGSSRLYLHYHTLRQVAVGGALGVVLATLWFSAWRAPGPCLGTSRGPRWGAG